MSDLLTLIDIIPPSYGTDPVHFIMTVPDPPQRINAAIGKSQALQKGVPSTTQLIALNGVGPFTWSATGLPSGVTLDSTSGQLSFDGTTAQGTYYPTITATDTGNANTAYPQPASLTIGAAFYIAGSLLQATVGSAYQSSLKAIGATGTVTWSMTGNPASVTIAGSTGLITGTPATGTFGSYMLTITAADAGTGTSSTVNVPLTINRNITTVYFDGTTTTLGTTTPPKCLAGAAYSTTCVATDALGRAAGTAPFTFAISGQPAGITINSMTGVISGKTAPDAAGDYPVVVTVTDVWGNTPNKSITPFSVVNGVKALGAGKFLAGDSSGKSVDVDYLSVYFGDGSDGAGVFDGATDSCAAAPLSGGVYSAGRDIYLTDATFSGTGKLIMNGFDLYCLSNLDLTNASAQAISLDASTNTRTWGGIGSLGGLGATGFGNAAQNASVAGARYGGSGNGFPQVGRGGQNASGLIGGLSGSAQISNFLIIPRHPASDYTYTDFPGFPQGSPFSGTTYQVAGGAGGGGGGGGSGNGTAKGGDGGAGGRGGSRDRIFARTITRGASTAAAAISARGANGFAGSPGAASGAGGGGGGAGGSGGAIAVFYAFLSGTPVTGLVDCRGGAFGLGGASGGGTATAGGTNQSGNGGQIYTRCLLDGTHQAVMGTGSTPAATAGSSPGLCAATL